jgi:hypothetical protein
MQNTDVCPGASKRFAGRFTFWEGRHVIDNDLAAELDALAEAIARMKPPSNHNPHAFHEDRSELASRARAIAKRARSGPTAKAEPEAAAAPIGRQTVRHSTRPVEGRTVLVLNRRTSDSPLAHPFY